MRYHFVRGADAERHGADASERSIFLATAAETDGRVSIFDSRLPAGRGAPWHYHERDDEIFYVISGRVEFGVDEHVVVAGPGDLVIAGPLVRRRFTALEDSHLVVVNAPGGPAEGFLRDLDSLPGPMTDVDRARFVERYGVHVL